SVFSRAWLIMSLAELGRFAEAAKYEAEAIRLAEPTEHAFTIGWAHFAASMLYVLKGDWAKARSRVGHWIAMLQSGNVSIHLPWAVASSAWAIAQTGEADEALRRVRGGRGRAGGSGRSSSCLSVTRREELSVIGVGLTTR